MKRIAMIIAAMTLTLMAAAQEGTYTGTLKAMVGGIFGPYAPSDNVDFIITQNADNTINVKVPGFSLAKTPIGDIVIGEYSVSNISYDETKGAYYRDYTKDGITMDFTMGGNKKNYEITKTGNITLKIEGNKVSITNNLCPGKMPVGDVAETFEGTAAASGISVATETAKGGAAYNMSGSPVAPDTRGIVIRGGKKYVNK